jgi:hypothetical protein
VAVLNVNFKHHVEVLQSSLEFLIIVANDRSARIGVIRFDKIARVWSYFKGNDCIIGLQIEAGSLAVPKDIWISYEDFPVLNIELQTGKVLAYSCMRSGLEATDIYFAQKSIGDRVDQLTIPESELLKASNQFKQNFATTTFLFNNGTGIPTWKPTPGEICEVVEDIQSISAMVSYRYYSTEELREQDYKLGKKVGGKNFNFGTSNIMKTFGVFGKFNDQLQDLKVSCPNFQKQSASIELGFQQLVRFRKDIRTKRKKESEIITQIDTILNGIKSLETVVDKEIEIASDSLTKCSCNLNNAIQNILNFTEDISKLNELIETKNKLLDSIEIVVNDAEKKLASLDYQKAIDDLVRIGKFEVEIKRLIGSVSSDDISVEEVDILEWITNRIEIASSAKEETEKQVDLLLEYFKQEKDNDEDFTAHSLLSSISHELEVLNCFNPPGESTRIFSCCNQI